MRPAFVNGCLTMALMLSCLAACTPEITFVQESGGTGPVTTSFTGDNYTVNFSSAAGTATVEFVSNRKWTAKFVNDRVADWCSISTPSGSVGKSTLVVKVEANDGYDQRYAQVDIVGEGLFSDTWRTIFIVQKQLDAVLISGDRYEMGRGGGTVTIEAKANVEYRFEIDESASAWISAASTKGLSSTVHTFVVAPNESFDKREGAIVFTSPAGTETVKVYQDGDEPSLVLSSDNVSLPAEGGEFTVEASSNYEATPEIEPGVEWIREVKTKSMSTSTFNFIADHNPGRLERNGRIVFGNKSLGRSDTVRVVQASKPIISSSGTIEVSGRGGMVSVEVLGSDPREYRLGLSDRWMSVAGQDVHEGKGRFFVEVQATDRDAPSRDGCIMVYYKDFEEPDSIAVHQYEWLPAFSFTTSAASVAVPDVEGDKIVGFVFWGDGGQDVYEEGLKHDYAEAGPHSVLVEIRGQKKIPFKRLEDGMTISFKELRRN